VIHLAALQFLRGDFPAAADIFWSAFRDLPSLALPLEFYRRTPLRSQLGDPSGITAARRGLVVALTSNSTADLANLRHALTLWAANVAPACSEGEGRGEGEGAGGAANAEHADEETSSTCTADGGGALPFLILHDGLSPAQAAAVAEWAEAAAWPRRQRPPAAAAAAARAAVEFVRLQDSEFERLHEARGGGWYAGEGGGRNGERGYMHMIRMYAGSLFHHPALHWYTHYVRLDTDGFFVGPAPADPVRQLARATERLRRESGDPAARVAYGYWWLTADQAGACNFVSTGNGQRATGVA
jgi:hypothetical protein